MVGGNPDTSPRRRLNASRWRTDRGQVKRGRRHPRAARDARADEHRQDERNRQAEVEAAGAVLSTGSRSARNVTGATVFARSINPNPMNVVVTWTTAS